MLVDFPGRLIRGFSATDFMKNLLSRYNDKDDEDVRDKNLMEHKKPYLKHCQHCIEEIIEVCSRGRNGVSKSVKRKKHFSSFICSLISEAYPEPRSNN